MKTRAAEILSRAGVSFEMRAYEEVRLGAEEVAEKLAIPLAQVWKTLVCKVDGMPKTPGASGSQGVVLAVVPGDRELDLKLLAKAAGGTRADLVPVDDIQRLTGYIRGGCSPLGAQKAGKDARYPVFLDDRALALPFICVSAGMRGLQIVLAAADLARVANAAVTRIAGEAG